MKVVIGRNTDWRNCGLKGILFRYCMKMWANGVIGSGGVRDSEDSG